MDELLTFLSAVPASRAVLCEDCKMITEAHGSTCPVCGSTAIVALAQFLLADTIKAGR